MQGYWPTFIGDRRQDDTAGSPRGAKNGVGQRGHASHRLWRDLSRFVFGVRSKSRAAQSEALKAQLGRPKIGTFLKEIAWC